MNGDKLAVVAMLLKLSPTRNIASSNGKFLINSNTPKI